MNHPLTEFFAGHEAVQTEIAGRVPDTSDHRACVRTVVDTYHPKRLTLRVDDVVVETATTKTFRLRRGRGEPLPPFLAGQYVAVFAANTTRALAISSSPARPDRYDLTVRRVAGGRVSNHLVDTLAVGDTVVTTGPMGTFHHNPLFHGDDVVFLAGGSGVAPAMSMIRDIVDHGLTRRFHLIYGSRDARDIIFEAELNSLVAEHPNIRVDHVILNPDDDWTGPSGLLSSDVINALAGPLNNRMVYVCGPQALYPYALQQLSKLGHPRRRIRFEANGAPSDPASQPHWPSDVDPAAHVTVTTAQGSFTTARNRPLLDALEDNGVRPESACRSGECSLCRVRIVTGEVHSAEEAMPRVTDSKWGYVHSCVAYPISDVEIDI
ncbi:MAG TPA: FAD-binding oxidoreductase [Mycobacterium sp.]|nr:FAD-binding oxidoreductase [Mycobacterium sp.]